jgi:hypothetical protein
MRYSDLHYSNIHEDFKNKDWIDIKEGSYNITIKCNNKHKKKVFNELLELHDQPYQIWSSKFEYGLLDVSNKAKKRPLQFIRHRAKGSSSVYYEIVNNVICLSKKYTNSYFYIKGKQVSQEFHNKYLKLKMMNDL